MRLQRTTDLEDIPYLVRLPLALSHITGSSGISQTLLIKAWPAIKTDFHSLASTMESSSSYLICDVLMLVVKKRRFTSAERCCMRMEKHGPKCTAAHFSSWFPREVLSLFYCTAHTQSTPAGILVWLSIVHSSDKFSTPLRLPLPSAFAQAGLEKTVISVCWLVI